ncbi:putative n-6 adenine-specific dna methyltransferase 2 [Erysiphe necator]|uniref:Protein-lysine N-methyltransferase EFM5 n=1 Tax=Uncinula necator TaxID=52586 RepID=A0A0B1P892_UNCNE|nr:putative n-6 adenine-specific dna methyltransferase 2 [Erysiphe necator]
MNDDDDEMPVLSDSTLIALQEFYAERTALEDSNNLFHHGLNMDIFTENWQYSQFWYDEETARKLATAVLSNASKGETIAMISAPSAYVMAKKLLIESGRPQTSWPKIILLEFDRRFKIFKDEFVFYDFKNPMQLPSELKGSINHIICDPPFLSDDCQTKVAISVKWLSKSWEIMPESRAEESRLVICTGERMEKTIQKLYQKRGIFRTNFEPTHTKQQLSNEFLCFANFECTQWLWKE